jgi:hypothetical protein
MYVHIFLHVHQDLYTFITISVHTHEGSKAASRGSLVSISIRRLILLSIYRYFCNVETILIIYFRIGINLYAFAHVYKYLSN